MPREFLRYWAGSRLTGKVLAIMGPNASGTPVPSFRAHAGQHHRRFSLRPLARTRGRVGLGDDANRPEGLPLV